MLLVLRLWFRPVAVECEDGTANLRVFSRSTKATAALGRGCVTASEVQRSRCAQWPFVFLITGKEPLLEKVHRVYFRGGLYTDQVAANASAARLYAERLLPKLGASVKTECLMLVGNGFRTHPKLDRSFLLLAVPREPKNTDLTDHRQTV